jgi:hypothetical protein
MTNLPPNSNAELDPDVAQFIKEFNLYVDSLSDADPASTPPAPTPRPTAPSTPRVPSAVEPHTTNINIPGDLWQTLERVCPYRGIKDFLVQAAREKLAQPHLPDLITAAASLARITEELLLTADDPPANAAQLLQELHEALAHFP